MTRADRAFAWLVYGCQFFFGGWFLFHGLNYWLAFYADQSIQPGPGLIPALVATGLMTIVKVLEVVIGVALLADVFTALAIVAAWPITLVIAYVNASHLSPFGITVGAIIIGLNAVMSFGHLDRYRPMLAMNVGPPGAGVAGDAKRMAPLAHVVAALAGVAAATLATFWSLTR